MSTSDGLNKKPLSSKKFIAFFFSMLLIAGILVVALLTQTFTWAMASFMSIGVFSVAVLAIGYILRQSALDKFLAGVNSISTGGTSNSNLENSEDG
jgi:ABC-type multidrug transport system fused ATPase/permease subunit